MTSHPNTSPLMRALAARGYVELTPVQSEVSSATAGGRDLLVSARTGSGKTVAYGLALGDTLLGGGDRLPAANAPLALVVAPTRELALQVERELHWLFAEAGGRIVACVGGMDPRAERRRLEGGAHIVVGTPGRLRDHIDRRALDLSALQAVVLDEADEMLDLGFRDDLEFILQATPAERRTLLFSATLPDAIVSIARRFQRDALRIETAGEAEAHADIEHRAIRVAPRQTDGVVVNLLRQHDAAAAIVFCSTREAVRRLHQTLSRRGFLAVLLSGELGQAERNRALDEIRDGRARVCVATDVAARGIDLANVELVVHADLPHDAEVFRHRSGRTGRAGRKGVSVLLAPASRRRKAELLLSDAGVVPVWSAPPSADEIRALDRDRLATDPAIAVPASPEELDGARELIERIGAEQAAVALMRLHLARLPAPIAVDDPGEWTPARGRPAAREQAPADSRLPRRREDFGDGVWFRLAVGRKQNADPKWILPLLCRRGGVTRAEIGAIRIFDRETKVAIAADAAAAFAASALGSEKGDVAITRAEGPGESAPRAEASREGRPENRPHKPVRDRTAVRERRPDEASAMADAVVKPWSDKGRSELARAEKPWAAKPRPVKAQPQGEPRDRKARPAGKPYPGRDHGAAGAAKLGKFSGRKVVGRKDAAKPARRRAKGD